MLEIAYPFGFLLARTSRSKNHEKLKRSANGRITRTGRVAAKIDESEDEDSSQSARPIRIATDGLRDKVRPKLQARHNGEFLHVPHGQ